MLKARATVTANKAEDIDFAKEYFSSELSNISDVERVLFFRDRVSPDGKSRVDITIEINPSETGRYRKGVKKSVQNILKELDVVAYF